MFCSKCGKELNDGSAFCNYCGSKISNGVSATVNTTEQKEIEIHMLESAKNYLNTIDPLCEKLEKEEEKKKILQRDISSGSSTNIIVGVISSIVAVITLLLAVQFLSIPKSSDVLLGNFFSSMNRFWGIVWVIVCVIAMIVLIVSFSTIPKRKRNIEKMKKEDAEINNQIIQTENQIREVLCDDDVKYNKSVYYLFFPNGDASPDDISYIINLMKTGRADSFKEALNLYDEHLHRNNLERMVLQQLIYARETANSSTVAAQAATEAASAARSTANAANYSAYYKQ